MFYHSQPEKNKKMYKRFLSAAGFLGHLSKPGSKIPRIDSTISEEIFCRSFNAENIANKDITIDCLKYNDGVGVKTFTGGSQQKIAQFKAKSSTTFRN